MEIRPDRILAPVDLSEPAQAALEAAKSLAADTGAGLDLVTVVEFPPMLGLSGAETSALSRQWKEYRGWATAELQKHAAELPKAKRRLRLAEGTPAVVLGRLARSGDYGLVVMGTHGYSGVKHVVFGSVAEALVRVAKCPVLTIPLASRFDRPKRVLLPYNMAGYADAALRRGVAFADSWGASVTALYVAEDPSQAAAAVEKLNARLGDVLGADEAQRVSAVVREGRSDRGILEEAVAGRHDLVVLAAHRKTFWQDAVLGMTAERILRHSPIPVLSVPSDAKK
ncbi:MAG: universal stress protein [Elusimicrobia bacterium]|nr:universal stress protein [Elusimicrobiota bacterium]